MRLGRDKQIRRVNKQIARRFPSRRPISKRHAPGPSDCLKPVPELRGAVSPLAFESRVGADINARQLGAVLLSKGEGHFESVLGIRTRVEVDNDVSIRV